MTTLENSIVNNDVFESIGLSFGDVCWEEETSVRAFEEDDRTKVTILYKRIFQEIYDNLESKRKIGLMIAYGDQGYMINIRDPTGGLHNLGCSYGGDKKAVETDFEIYSNIIKEGFILEIKVDGTAKLNPLD